MPCDNESAVAVLGNEDLALIARELIGIVRKSVFIDWSVKQGTRTKIPALVKRILRKYGYPPDLQEKTTETVLEQAELLAGEWVTMQQLSIIPNIIAIITE
jgi:type I restriction enzyme R subunit